MGSEDAPGQPGSPVDEQALLQAARRGDSAAFERLLEPELGVAYALALRLIGDRQDAADVVQEAAVAAFQSVRRFRGGARFRTWFLRIVHNKAIDAWRARQRHPHTLWGSLPPEGDGAGEEAEAVDPEALAMARLQRMELSRALASLEVPFRVAVVLRDVYGLGYREIAAVVGVPVGTVKSRVARGRSMLRLRLSERDPELWRRADVLKVEGVAGQAVPPPPHGPDTGFGQRG